MHLFKQKRGAFLTLGITFLSLLLLVLVSIILKNAETSEERLAEFASFERISTLDTSLQRASREGFLTIFGMNMSSNTTSLHITQPLARTLSTESDERFTHFATYHYLSTQYLLTRHSLYTASPDPFYPLLNHTLLFTTPLNLSYGYFSIDTAADLDLSTLPALPPGISQHTNAVLLVLNQSLDLRLRLTHPFHPSPPSPNPTGQGLVSWDLSQGTEGPQLTLTVESVFPSYNHSLTSTILTQTSTGEIAQRIFLNYTIAARPLIEIGKFIGGPFDTQTGVLIAPFDNNVTLDVEFSFPDTGSPLKLSSYDNFTISLPDIPIAKTSSPRIL